MGFSDGLVLAKEEGKEEEKSFTKEKFGWFLDLIIERLDADICSGEIYEVLESCPNLKSIKYTIAHRLAIDELRRKLPNKGYSLMFHDTDKLAFYLYMEHDLACELHQMVARHHSNDTDDYICYERALDWESSHLTKPDKPLSAYSSLIKNHKNLVEVMRGTLEELGLWGIEGYEPITEEEFQRTIDEISIGTIVRELHLSLEYLRLLSGKDTSLYEED